MQLPPYAGTPRVGIEVAALALCFELCVSTIFTLGFDNLYFTIFTLQPLLDFKDDFLPLHFLRLIHRHTAHSHRKQTPEKVMRIKCIEIVLHLVPANSIILTPKAKIVTPASLSLHCCHQQPQGSPCGHHQQQQHGCSAALATLQCSSYYMLSLSALKVIVMHFGV